MGRNLTNKTKRKNSFRSLKYEKNESNQSDSKTNHDVELDIATVANLDENIESKVLRTRPRRHNAGSGVERLQADFSNTGYWLAR